MRATTVAPHPSALEIPLPGVSGPKKNYSQLPRGDERGRHADDRATAMVRRRGRTIVTGLGSTWEARRRQSAPILTRGDRHDPPGQAKSAEAMADPLIWKSTSGARGGQGFPENPCRASRVLPKSIFWEARALKIPAKSLISMVGAVGFEPTTR